MYAWLAWWRSDSLAQGIDVREINLSISFCDGSMSHVGSSRMTEETISGRYWLKVAKVRLVMALFCQSL